MAYILHIESTSTVCSVALSHQTDLLAVKEVNNGYTHAENLHVFIERILEEASVSASQLNAVSVSSGPGSYTGLRIGFSAAKGLAYALNIPLIIVDSLKALTVLALTKNKQNAFYCPMTDARRMEVYTALYTHELKEISAPNALVLSEESIQQFNNNPVYFFGDGMPKAKELLQTLTESHFIEAIVPSAEAMITTAYGHYLNKEFADTAYAEPAYLKEFFFTTSKK